jgi:hypothetical protein
MIAQSSFEPKAMDLTFDPVFTPSTFSFGVDFAIRTQNSK